MDNPKSKVEVQQTFGRVILILRPSCKEEAKDIYTVFQFFRFDNFSE